MTYKCPNCQNVFTSSVWNDSSLEFYDEEIFTPIEEAEDGNLYVCSHCTQEFSYEQLKQGSKLNVVISKEEYKELLEYKALYEGLCK